MLQHLSRPLQNAVIFRTLSLLFLVCQLVSALPYNEVARNFPSNVTHISFNEDSGQYQAYHRDGSLYGTYYYDPTRHYDEHTRRAAATICAPLSIDEAKTLTGFPQLEAYANANWGTGARNEVTNDPGQSDSPATACVSSDVAQVQLSGTPVCTPSNGVTNASVSGTTGTITSSVTQGYTNSGQWSVTTASSIGVSATVSATIGIPDIGSIGSSLTTSATFTNTVAQGFTTTASTQTGNQLTFNVPSGESCHVTYDSTTCNVGGTGQVRYVASGWVWFEYISTVQGHYKWAVSIDNVITNLDDRSSFMVFTGSIQANTNANFNAVCQ